MDYGVINATPIYDREYNFIPKPLLDRTPPTANPLKTAKMQNIKGEFKKN